MAEVAGHNGACCVVSRERVNCSRGMALQTVSRFIYPVRYVRTRLRVRFVAKIASKRSSSRMVGGVRPDAVCTVAKKAVR